MSSDSAESRGCALQAPGRGLERWGSFRPGTTWGSRRQAMDGHRSSAGDNTDEQQPVKPTRVRAREPRQSFSSGGAPVHSLAASAPGPGDAIQQSSSSPDRATGASRGLLSPRSELGTGTRFSPGDILGLTPPGYGRSPLRGWGQRRQAAAREPRQSFSSNGATVPSLAASAPGPGDTIKLSSSSPGRATARSLGRATRRPFGARKGREPRRSAISWGSRRQAMDGRRSAAGDNIDEQQPVNIASLSAPKERQFLAWRRQPQGQGTRSNKALQALKGRQAQATAAPTRRPFGARKGREPRRSAISWGSRRQAMDGRRSAAGDNTDEWQPANIASLPAPKERQFIAWRRQPQGQGTRSNKALQALKGRQAQAAASRRPVRGTEGEGAGRPGTTWAFILCQTDFQSTLEIGLTLQSCAILGPGGSGGKSSEPPGRKGPRSFMVGCSPEARPCYNASADQAYEPDIRLPRQTGQAERPD